MSFRVFVLWLHLLAVVAWVGGAFFWMIVLLSRGKSEFRQEETPWIETLGRRFFVIGWEALSVVVITGIFNLIDRARMGVLFQSVYLTPLFIKLSLVAGMVGVQGWQHVGLLPRVADAAASGDTWTKWRQHMLLTLGAFLALAAGALWMGVRLRYV